MFAIRDQSTYRLKNNGRILDRIFTALTTKHNDEPRLQINVWKNDSWRHLKICNFRYKTKTLKSYIRYLFHPQHPVIKGCDETLSKKELHEGSSWNIAVTVVKVGVYAAWQ